jgi:hypothetical protein
MCVAHSGLLASSHLPPIATHQLLWFTYRAAVVAGAHLIFTSPAPFAPQLKLIKLVRLVRLVNFIAWVKGQTRPNDDEGPGKNKEVRAQQG